jgi:PBP1b-binding outer membrane lipoprotein LpoB
MKILSVLSILCFAFLLASCTQTENSSSPVAPIFNKTTEAPGINTHNPYPFPLLTSFKTYQTKSWNSASQANQVTVMLMKSLPVKSITFAVVEYYSPGPAANMQKVMTFLYYQSGDRVNVPVTPGKKIYDIKIYGLVGNSVDVNSLYNDFQKFNNVKIDQWKTSGKTITVTASNNINNVSQVYAEIQYNNESVLVFMQKPSTPTFTIPNFGSSTITSVTLYGLQIPITPSGF